MHKIMEEINSLESLLKPCPFCGGGKLEYMMQLDMIDTVVIE